MFQTVRTLQRKMARKRKDDLMDNIALKLCVATLLTVFGVLFSVFPAPAEEGYATILAPADGTKLVRGRSSNGRLATGSPGGGTGPCALTRGLSIG